MTREEVLTYVAEEYGTEPDFPWEKDFESAVLRHKGTRKWYGLVMYVGADKLGYPSEERLSILTLKADPMLIDTLVEQDGFHRAYHMNKTQWLTIELGDKVTAEQITSLIDMSFELTDAKTKRNRVQ